MTRAVLAAGGKSVPNSGSKRANDGGVRANIVWYALPRVLAHGSSILLLPIYTRVLSVAEMGTVTVVLAFSGMVALVITPGIDAVYLRWAFRRETDGGPRAVGTLLVVHLGLLAGTLALLILAAPFLASILLPGVPLWPFYYVMLITAALDSLSVPVQTAWRAEHRADKLAMFGIASGLVSVGMILIGLFVLRWGAVSVLLGDAAADALFLPLYIRKISRGLMEGWAPALMRHILPLIGASLPISISVWALTAVDRILLNRFAGPAQVGLYGVAYQFGAALMMVTIILNKEWQFLVFQIPHRDRQYGEAIQGLWKHSLRLFLVIGAAISLLAEDVVRIGLGPAYRACASIIPIIIVIAVLRVAHSFLVDLGLARGAARTLAIESGMAIAVFVVLNLVLIPMAGSSGAGLAGVGAYMTSCVFLYSRSWNTFGLERSLVGWFVVFLSAVILAIVGGGSTAAEVLGLLTSGLVVYYGIQYWALLGTLRPVAVTL